MKLQYLGDSKDSFKWDYLDSLVGALGYDRLKIAWMMTSDDQGPDGKTSPEHFPARPEILDQHHRRKKFPEDFSRIHERLPLGYATAIYSHSLMFASLSSHPETIGRIAEINRNYAKNLGGKVNAICRNI